MSVTTESGTNRSLPAIELPVLEYLERELAGSLRPEHRTHMHYPTPIFQTLGFQLMDIGEGTATVTVDATRDKFGGQQGTIHGGVLMALAEATIGTACSTLSSPEDSFATISFNSVLVRPAWDEIFVAEANPTHVGSTISHWYCEIVRNRDRETVMTVTSTITKARGLHTIRR